MSYYAHDEDTFDKIKEQIDTLTDIGITLPSWPMKFVQDMRNRLAKYGREIHLSDGQIAKLDEIYVQYCTEVVDPARKDTKDMFDELENRDKNRRF